MATVMAPMFSFRAKGTFAKTIQIQPQPYTKAPDAMLEADLKEFDIEWIDGSKDKGKSFLAPISSAIGNKCELYRTLKITPRKAAGWGCGRCADLDARMECVKKQKAHQQHFIEVRKRWNELSKLEKGSWEIFGLQFLKEDLCNLVVDNLKPFEIFMSYAMFAKLLHGVLLRWAPIMTNQLSVEAGKRGFQMSYWYYQTKLSQLRRAWMLYRKHKYTLKQAMQTTEVWNKYKKWRVWRGEMEAAADLWWKGLIP